MPGMLEGVAARTFAPLMLRLALAAVFIFHGLEKVTPSNHYEMNWRQPDEGSAPQVLINAPPLQSWSPGENCWAVWRWARF